MNNNNKVWNFSFADCVFFLVAGYKPHYKWWWSESERMVTMYDDEANEIIIIFAYVWCSMMEQHNIKWKLICGLFRCSLITDAPEPFIYHYHDYSTNDKLSLSFHTCMQLSIIKISVYT